MGTPTQLILLLEIQEQANLSEFYGILLLFLTGHDLLWSNVEQDWSYTIIWL